MEQQKMNIQQQIMECQRCGHSFSTKGNLLQHLRRKVSCPSTQHDISTNELIASLTKREYNEKTYDCTFCERQFNTWQSRSRHHKICKKRLETETNKNDQMVVVPLTAFEEMKHKVEILEAKIAAQPINNTTINTTNNINNGTVNNIHIHAFGKEDISYITEHPRIHDAFMSFLKKRGEGLCTMIKHKHFHPKHPENHNIKKVNKKDTFIHVYNGSEWVPRDMEVALDDIFLSLQHLFANFIESMDNVDKVRSIVDQFMKEVGEPLGWDLDCDGYTYDQEHTDKEKEKYKKQLFRLACEYIYIRSKDVFA